MPHSIGLVITRQGNTDHGDFEVEQQGKLYRDCHFQFSYEKYKTTG